MKNLIEIAKIVTKKKVRKIEIFDDSYLENKNSKFNEFYEALTQWKFKTDRDASEFLYGATPTDDRYRQLKSRFRKRLLNTLFFLDVNKPSASNYDRAYYSSNKDWTLVKILLSNDAHATAASLARQILTISLRFKFADVIVNCARILRNHAAIEGEDTLYEEYDQYIKEYSHILDAEIRSEELYQRVILNYYKPPTKRIDLTEKIDTYCNALDGLTEQYDSPIIKYNKYLVWVYRHEMLGEYEKMLDICRKVEDYVENNPIFYQSDKMNTIYLKKISAFLHLKGKVDGFKEANSALESFTKGNNEWYTYNEFYFLYALQSGAYEAAQEVYNNVLNYNKFKFADDEIQDKWAMFEPYLHYAITYMYKGRKNLAESQRRPFKVKKFLSTKALYSKHQRIYLIHKISMQILLLIQEGRFTPARELIAQLKGYINRQFRKEEYFRTIQFIRLLQQLPKADFVVSQLSNVDKYYSRLTEEQPFYYRGLLMELEIIPYEDIWDHILEVLKKKSEI